MKRTVLLCLLLGCLQTLKSQVTVKHYTSPQVQANGFFNAPAPLQEIILPAINLEAVLAAEKLEGTDKPFRFAESIPVNIAPEKDGSWTDDGSTAIWRTRITSRKAYSLSLNFSRFQLPPGTVMYIYNHTGDMVLGPVTAAENNIHNTWGSGVMKGASLIIELKVPAAAKEQLQLQIDRVAHGYKNIFDKNFGDAGSCNNNVLCPEGNGWENDRAAVALLLLANDTRWCSGALVNNAAGLNIPYLLTAFHCTSGQSVTNWKFIFHYWSPTCTPNQNGSTSLLFNHADLRASYSPSDFALLQLQQTPAAGSGIAYAGWSRSATAPTNTTAIHHPSGDVMKITFDNQAAVKTAYGGGSGNNHWQANWDDGVTEGGSSGSPLFDQNHRVRGQLHGGPSSCTSSDKRDFYGSFDISWTGGGTNSTRLSNWLDPNNTAVVTVDNNFTLNIAGADFICNNTPATYTVTGNGITSVQWSVASGLVTLTTNSNNATLTPRGNGSITLVAAIQANGQTITKTKSIGVGVPAVGGFYTSNGLQYGLAEGVSNNVCTTPPVTSCFVDMTVSGASSVVWDRDFSTPGVSWSQSGHDLNLSFRSGTQQGDFMITATNQCGVNSKFYSFSSVTCSNLQFTVNPNPARNQLTVALQNTSQEITGVKTAKTVNSNIGKMTYIREIRIYDAAGKLRKHQRFNGQLTRVQLAVTGLNAGIYFVEVSDGKNKSVEEIIVQE